MLVGLNIDTENKHGIVLISDIMIFLLVPKKSVTCFKSSISGYSESNIKMD